MDVLDEKANGVPPMEIDEIVSVHDRESYVPYVVAGYSRIRISPLKTRLSRPSIYQT